MLTKTFRFAADDGAGQSIKCSEGFNAGSAICTDADTALEVAQGQVGLLPEDAVNAGSVKS